MRIYTRTGDTGETGLLGGIRVPKDHVRVTAYGEIDDLNAHVGSLRVAIEDPGVRATMEEIQNLLLEAGTEMATPPASRVQTNGLNEKDVKGIEDAIDRIDSTLPPLTHFILPGGSEAACRAHLARCACRSAERAVVHLLRVEPGETAVLRYLNRLSDYLFVVARWANRVAGVPDILWHSRGLSGPSNPPPAGTADPPDSR